MVTDVQFGHLFLVCIKYEITITGSYLCLWVIHKNITLVSTYTRIILCFSYLLHKTETIKGCDGRTQRNELSGTTQLCS